MTNEQLVILIQAGENMAENMAQLYEQVKAFIHAAAWRYRDSGELEDLEQEGYLALYPAIDGYDPAQGVKFLTYAEYHIRQRMRRYLQMNGSCLRLPAHCLEQIGRYKRFVSGYGREYGRAPANDEIAAFLGFTLEQVEDIQENACMAHLGSLDAPLGGMEGEDVTLSDAIAAPGSLEEDIVDKVQAEELKAVLWGCVDALPGRQPDVLRMRYQEEQSLRAIGETYGTTPEAVRQIHAKALRELRKPQHSKRLRPFLPEVERIYSMALVGNGAGKFHQTWTSSTERAALWLMEREEERRREHLEMLERVRQSVATSQQNRI